MFEVRGLKIQITEVPVPVPYGSAFEGERVRKASGLAHEITRGIWHSALDEDRDNPAFVLHVMDENGLRGNHC